MDELTLHRYLDGRLDERERGVVEAALRSDPVARRSLDALREEAQLIGAALEARSEPMAGTGRIGSKVVAQLTLEERSRSNQVRTRKLFWNIAKFTGLAAAALWICFFLVWPRTPAGSLLSGTHATVTVHGEKRDAKKGAHLYDGDSIQTEKGQFVRLGLSGAQVIDLDEFSELSIEKSGKSPATMPVVRLAHGRMGVAVGESQSSVQIELPQGVVTVYPGSRADVWLPDVPETPASAQVRLPEMFFGMQAPSNVAPAVQGAPAIVTVFNGYALVSCAKSESSLRAARGVRAQFTKMEILPRLVNIAGSRVLNVRGDDGLHTRDNLALSEWTLLGLMEKPQFVALGRSWGLTRSEAQEGSQIGEALRQLDAAMQITSHAERAEKIAAGQQALRQASEALPQNDERRRMALTLEGLAHFEQGCARFSAGGQKGSDPYAPFEAARVAFDAAIAPDTGANGAPMPSAASDWRTALAASSTGNTGGAAATFSNMPPEAQAALTASFGRVVAMAWSARIMPAELPLPGGPQWITLDSEETAVQAGERVRAAKPAAEAFAQLHNDLGHSVESLAALLGEALCEELAGDAVSRRKALDALEVIISTSFAGTDGPARQTFESIRKAALIELIRLNGSGLEAQKTLDAAHDYELLYPLEINAQQTKDVRTLLMKCLESQKTAALKEKRFDNAVEACDALWVALDEADGHWLDAGSQADGEIRNVGMRLDRFEALVGAQDWQRASHEAHVLTSKVPADMLPRFDALRAQVRAAAKK